MGMETALWARVTSSIGRWGGAHHSPCLVHPGVWHKDWLVSFLSRCLLGTGRADLSRGRCGGVRAARGPAGCPLARL